MSVELMLQTTFENTPLPVLEFRGKPAWLLRDLGRALGYANDGKRLVGLLRDTWADQFEEGLDFEVIQGEDLDELKALLREVPSHGTSQLQDAAKTHRVTLLYESGVNLIAILCRKPLGTRLRRWLAREVLPSIRATGAYDLHADGTVSRRDRDPEAQRARLLLDASRQLRTLTRDNAYRLRLVERAASLVAPDIQPARKEPVPNEIIHRRGRVVLAYLAARLAGVGRRPASGSDWAKRVLELPPVEAAPDAADADPFAEDPADLLEDLRGALKALQPRGQAVAIGRFLSGYVGETFEVDGGAVTLKSGVQTGGRGRVTCYWFEPVPEA